MLDSLCRRLDIFAKETIDWGGAIKLFSYEVRFERYLTTLHKWRLLVFCKRTQGHNYCNNERIQSQNYANNLTIVTYMRNSSHLLDAFLLDGYLRNVLQRFQL